MANTSTERNLFKLTFILFLLCTLKFGKCSVAIDMDRAESGYNRAKEIMDYYFKMFDECLNIAAPSQHFLLDNLHSYVNYPSKTTVGIAPKFTNNRKFFANLLSTNAFKKMLAADEEELRKEFVRKLRYCDATIMDQGVLQDFYDREIDSAKM